MLQKLIAFILLVSHINSSMLLPQVAEEDVYYNGQQTDDINTVVEYIQQEILDIPDDSPEDEDDDKGKEFNPLKIIDQTCDPKFRFIQVIHPGMLILHQFFDRNANKAQLMSFDILTPPPRA